MPRNPTSGTVSPKLEARLALLEEVFVKFTRDEATHNIIGGGFGNVSEQLISMTRHLQGINEQMAPLRQLGGTKPNLDRDQKARLKHLIKAWSPPDWKRQTAVTIPEFPVRHIGHYVPEQPLMALEADSDDRSATS
jgi:hypothetical protein